MSDLNEYVAEAIETAYGVDYDTAKAQEVIDTLKSQRWEIEDVEYLDELRERATQAKIQGAEFAAEVARLTGKDGE